MVQDRRIGLATTDVLRIDSDRWRTAQEFELRFAQNTIDVGDDYNLWWYAAFNRYEVLKGKDFTNVIEVGCGPHTNIRLILPLIRFEHLWLEDPLIHEYVKMKKERRILRFLRFTSPTTIASLARRYPVSLLSEKLEDLSLPDKSIDLCICINVLDHVQDVDQCFRQMRRILRSGVLILAQDLSNEEDRKRCPESWSDIGHPIKMDAEFLDSQLREMAPLYRRILPREEGRNPRCHYGTYLFIGQQNLC
jgi:SAM-dependent methyltransferase